MDREIEYWSNLFLSVYIPPRLIHHHLIMFILETENCLVASLIYIFVYVFNEFHAAARFHVYVCLKSL